MLRILRIVLSTALLLSGAFAFASGGGGTGGGATCTCVSLSISKEVAPPGALAQLKVFITEPKPISTGGGSLTFDAYDTIYGISLSSHSRDSYGVALVNGGNVKLSVISPAATLGSTIDYPLLTVVGRIPPATPNGTKFPMTLDPASLQLYDTNGVLYPIDVKQGHIIAGSSVAIGEVTPGSAVIPPGGTVMISGANFVSGTKIKFAEANIASQQFIDSGHIMVTLATTAVMHGMMIKASNPDGTSSTYFSYQRAFPTSPSADPVMRVAYPLLPPIAANVSTVSFPDPAPGTTYGVAVQNITADTTAFVEWLDASSTTIATASVDLPVNRFAVREVGELFGSAPYAASTVRVTSAVPIEVLGIAADQTAGTARPIIAAAATN